MPHILTTWTPLVRRHRHTLLFCLVLIAFITSKLYDFPKRYWTGGWDVGRDYLVASHIVKYHEFPKNGPISTYFALFRSTPSYYYVLSLALLAHNSILFLGIFNIALQSVTLLMTYLLGMELFSAPVGIIAALLYAFSRRMAISTMFIWQPHVMQPFFVSSLYLFWIGYKRHNFVYTITATCLYIFSIAMHISILTTLPLVCLFVIWSLYKNKASAIQYITIAISAFAQLYVTIVPTMNGREQNQISFIQHTFASLRIPTILSQIAANVISFYRIFFPEHISLIFPPSYSIILLTILAVVYLWLRAKSVIKVCILLFFVIFVIIVKSIFFPEINDYYTMSAFIPFLLIVSELMHRVTHKYVFIEIVLISTLLLTASNNGKSLFRIPEIDTDTIWTMARSIQTTVNTIKHTDPNADINFDITVLEREPQIMDSGNAIYWVALENITGTKYTRVINEGNNYVTLNGNKYYFVICLNYAKNLAECTNQFLARHSEYTYIDTIYTMKYASITYFINTNGESY